MSIVIQPPTSYLPPITEIATFTSVQLLDALSYLRSLYRPKVRGSRRKRAVAQSSSKIVEQRPSKAAPYPSDDNDIQRIRSDAFERSYAIRWLTVLIAQIEAWEELSQTDRAIQGDLDMVVQPTAAHTEMLIQQAASLLAVCAGVAAAGKLQRVFTFESSDAGKIEVQVTDIPLENHDYASVGAQTWGGACVLAEMIVENPERFGMGLEAPLGDHDEYAGRTLRVLELGAGTGLVALTAAKMMHVSPAWKNRQADVVATDFHPSVLTNLEANIDANFFPTAFDDRAPSVSISSHFLDWSIFPETTPKPLVFSSPFDIVLGADIVYETQHAVWIRDCLKLMLRYPDQPTLSETAVPAFHLVIPLRPTHVFESSTVEAVFPWADKCPHENLPELVILSQESIVCDAGGDREIGWKHADEDVEYVYYRIGWLV
ncbi:hypothetical protein F5I97DRAFT_1899406 [Phlebopus sp. FC_14]|nr:hypothetical protein F5I97DRAFT_1899406 [Phlebopus sp. FC_14]